MARHVNVEFHVDASSLQRSLQEAQLEMPGLLTIQEAAAYLNVPVATLRWWRAQGRGPRSMKLGRHVRYDKADLDQWINEQKGNGSWGS
jgi:excisionase family DNA binding protein